MFLVLILICGNGPVLWSTYYCL